MHVEPGTIQIWSDIGCPWAHVAVARLLRYRRQMGLEASVRIDHRPFPLELFNDRPTPFRTLAAEIPVLHSLEPEAGWQVWDAPPWQWPVTTLPALEAVQAAKYQSLEASELLDVALRRALFAESRCVSMRSVILDVASKCDGVDEEAIAAALDAGTARRTVIAAWRQAADLGIEGSPHAIAPGGRGMHNPGVAMHLAGGFPVIESDDPSVYRLLLRAAA